jgi:hypothetical protein
MLCDLIDHDEARDFALATEPHGELRLAVMKADLAKVGIEITRSWSYRVCPPWFEHVKEVQMTTHRMTVREAVIYVTQYCRPFGKGEDGLPCEITMSGRDEYGQGRCWPMGVFL